MDANRYNKKKKELDGARATWGLTSKDGVGRKYGRKENGRTAKIPDTGLDDGLMDQTTNCG